MKHLQTIITPVALLFFETNGSGMGSATLESRERWHELKRNTRRLQFASKELLFEPEDGEAIFSSKKSKAKKSQKSVPGSKANKSKESKSKKSKSKKSKSAESGSSLPSSEIELPPMRTSETELSAMNLDSTGGSLGLSCADWNPSITESISTDTQYVTSMVYDYKLQTNALAAEGVQIDLKIDMLVYFANGVCPKRRLLKNDFGEKESRRLDILRLESMPEDEEVGICTAMNTNNTCMIYRTDLTIAVDSNSTKIAKEDILERLDSYVAEERFLTIEGVIAMDIIDPEVSPQLLMSKDPENGNGNQDEAIVGMTAAIIGLAAVLIVIVFLQKRHGLSRATLY